MMCDILDPIKTSNNRQTGSPSHRQCPRTTGLAIIDGRLASASPQAVQLDRCRHGGVAPFKLHVGKLESKIQGFSHDTCMANWQIGKLHVPHSRTSYVLPESVGPKDGTTSLEVRLNNPFGTVVIYQGTKFQQWLCHGVPTILLDRRNHRNNMK